MASLISTNPAVQGMSDMANVQRQQMALSAGRMQYEEAQRTRDAEHAVDQALRQWILEDGGLGQTGGDVGAAQPAAALGEGGMPAASPQPTAPQQGGSLQNVPVPGMSPAPGPQATMGRGDAPGFQGVLAQVLPPEAQGQVQPVPGTMSAPPGAHQQVPNAVPGMQPKMVPLQNPPMPGTVTTPPAVRTMGLDRQALARRLAAVEGGGTAAYELLREQDELNSAEGQAARQEHDHAVTNFFASIDKGDTYSAQYWAAQAGMDIPEEMYGDAEAMRVLGVAGKYKTFYGSDVESFGQFLGDAFKRVHAGDPNAFQNAFEVHRPRKVAGAAKTVSPANQAYDALLKKHGGDAVAAYKEWKAIGGSGSGSGQTTFEQRKQFAEKLYPNDPEAQANFINGRSKPTRTEIRKLAVDELKARYGSNTPMGEDWDRELRETITEYETLAYQNVIPPDDGAGEDVDFAVQGRIPTAEENEYTADTADGPIYSNDGQTWYDDAGNRIGQ